MEESQGVEDIEDKEGIVGWALGGFGNLQGIENKFSKRYIVWLVGVRRNFFLLKQCGFCCANHLNKLELSFVITFRVDDQGDDEKHRDFNEWPF